MRKSSMATRLFGTPVVPPVSNTYTGIARQPSRHPAAHRTSAQPFVLKRRKFASRSSKPWISFRGSQSQLGGKLQPERTSGLRIEVPLDDLAHMSIKLLFCLRDWSSDEAPTALRSKPGRNTSHVSERCFIPAIGFSGSASYSRLRPPG